MKTKTSVTLSADVLAEVDALAGPGTSRSAFIERALRWFIQQRRYAATDARDLQTLNRHAEDLNAEAADVREYQTAWPEE